MSSRNKSYKQKYRELKSQLDIDRSIKTHTTRYIHIPFSWPAIGLFFLLLASLVLSIANIFLIISVGHDYGVWGLLKNPEEAYHSFSQLIIVWPLLGEYLLIGLFFVCLTALIKGGFNKLKRFNEDGLFFGLFVGLHFGLFSGLFSGLFFGLLFGLFFGLPFGMLFGLFYGLTVGLIDEFKGGR